MILQWYMQIRAECNGSLAALECQNSCELLHTLIARDNLVLPLYSAGLTSITLERCQVDQNPLPLLLTLPQLSAVSIRNVSRAGGSDIGMPRLTPMTRPQQQLTQSQQKLAASAAGCCHPNNGHTQTATRATAAAGRLVHMASGSSMGSSGSLWLGSGSLLSLDRARSNSSASSSSLLLVNTSITSLALIDVRLQRLPSCVSQLVALQELNIALNHDMALNSSTCLPEELTALSSLQGLCLGHCGLTQLPTVIADCSGLTRLELQGNALSLSGLSWHPVDVGFRHSLQVLDIGSQGTGGTRMRGIPAWIGACSALRELRIGCYCLGHSGCSYNQSEGNMHVSQVCGAGHAVYTAPLSPISGGSGGYHAAPAGCSPVRGGNARSSGHAAASTGTNTGRSSITAGASGTNPGNGAGGSPCAGLVAEGLSLQQLPEMLPQLEVLQVDGGVWEQRAVRDALQLVRRLERSGSRLQVILPL